MKGKIMEGIAVLPLIFMVCLVARPQTRIPRRTMRQYVAVWLILLLLVAIVGVVGVDNAAVYWVIGGISLLLCGLILYFFSRWQTD